MVQVVYSQDDKKAYDAIKYTLSEEFRGVKTLAIKIHFGEPGNKTAFTPEDIEPIINILEELNISYFLYDSSVMYGGLRSDPKTHKEYAESKGFKKVITGDEYITIKGNYIDHEVCKKLGDADAVLILTHIKGHVCSGFGGAIKNLGMGALTKKTKIDIHQGGMPTFSGDCIQCGICVKQCPISDMHIEEDKPYPIVDNCYGCSVCAMVCPKHVIKPKVAYFDQLLADGANAAQSTFKKRYYISYLKNITKECDCNSDPKDIIAHDMGILCSTDAVAIDKAAYDIIKKSAGDIFMKHNHKKGTEQIDAAERLGMGTSKYELKEI